MEKSPRENKTYQDLRAKTRRLQKRERAERLNFLSSIRNTYEQGAPHETKARAGDAC